jgi:uncharacterized protein (TIGR01777 family)
MRIFVLGGTGFIGSHLLFLLLQQEHAITAMAHLPKGAALLQKIASGAGKKIEVIQGDGMQEGGWQQEVGQADAVINLAGIDVVRTWTDKVKQEIHNSRVATTRHVVQAMHSGQFLYNASAIGYYDHRYDVVCTEESPCGKNFLATVCQAWEKEAATAGDKGVRFVIARQGIVLGHGGILEEVAKMYRRFLSSQIGSGQQWFNWIHMQDLLNAIVYCMENTNYQGIYNVCSPVSVRNQELGKILADAFHRRALLTVPSLVVELAMGEAADLLLQGSKVYPQRLLTQGFKFKFPNLQEAVQHLLKDASWISNKSFLS